MANKKLWVFLALAAALLLCGHFFGWADWIADPAGLPEVRRLLRESPVLAGLLYLGCTVAGCVLLALPGVTFAIAAGVLFGPWWGTLLCWAAVTVGACLSFVAGRYFLKDALKPRLEKSAALQRLLFSGTGKSDLFLLAVTRLLPIFPYNLQNFAYGVTDIGFAPYALYSALFMLPGTAAYTLGAAGLAQPEKRLPYLLGGGALLVLVLAVSRLLRKRMVQP